MSKKVEKFEDLVLWQNASILATRVYEITEKSPFSTDYETRHQVRRTAADIGHHIAMGYVLNQPTEFLSHLKQALASSAKLRSQMHLLMQSKLITQEAYQYFFNELVQMSEQIRSLIEYLQNKRM
jgi:four helix bundle protein